MIKHYGKTIHQGGMIVVGSIDMENAELENLNRLRIDKWSFDLDEEGDLCINYEDEVRVRITSSNEVTINLHHERYFMVQPINVDKCIGFLVSNLPRYYNLDITQRANTQALPTICLSDKPYDRSTLGIIVGYEKYERNLTAGTLQSVCNQNDDLNRVLVTNRGTTVVWVCDINGELHNGDYITSSGIQGYGMNQGNDIKYNYTVCKITQDCDFKPGIILMERPVEFDEKGPIYEAIKNTGDELITDVEYEIKYIDLDGKAVMFKDFTNDLARLIEGGDIYDEKGIIIPELLEHPERRVFRAAKVGCYFT